MSQKIEKPTLSGQRIKTRKRDEKEKYDPTGFRDAVLQGLAEAGTDLDAVTKFLDTASSKLDYRRYGETLFDILLAGGILAPGGSLLVDGDPSKAIRSEVSIFAAADDIETLKGYAQIFLKLTRRYKYLEKTLEDEFKKVLVFLKGFSPEERCKLAKVLGLLIAGGQISPSVLINTLQDHLVKDGIALEFVMDVLKLWQEEKDTATISAAFRKAGLDMRLMEFLPVSKRTQENLNAAFISHGLEQFLGYQKAQEDASVKKELQNQVVSLLKEGTAVKDIVPVVKDYMIKLSLTENEVVVLLWNSLMAVIEWNKKEELVAEQAIKHLRQYTALLQAFTKTFKSELALLIKAQEYCYGNMNFMKAFQKIVYMLYKTDVVGEEAIKKWYKESHSSKGKSIFLEQMKAFVDWLENAEEESEGEED